MERVQDSLDHFIGALENDQYIIADPHTGVWKCEHWLVRFVRWIFFLQHEDDLFARVAQSFIFAMDQLERNPLLSQSEGKKYLKAAKLLNTKLKRCFTQQSKKTRLQLETRNIAFKYRVESAYGGVDRVDVDESLCQTLCQKAQDWKENQELISETLLTQSEKEKLRITSTYPMFAKALSCDQDLCHSFFIWVLRHHNDPSVFIEYPGMQDLIRRSLMSSRIGRFRDDTLRIINEGGKKDLQLLFEGKHISILDSKRKVHFKKGSLIMTIEKIFQVFASNKKSMGNLELLSDGVNNWNSYQLGWYDQEKKVYSRVDLKKDNWWRQLPKFENLSCEETSSRYGHKLDGKKWIFSPSASRQSIDAQFGGAHAYLEVAIPNNKGEYGIYYFGKYPELFPQSPLDFIKLIARAAPAAITYPDENVFYTHREHTGYPIEVTSQEGVKLMESIKKDIQNARNGNFWFQLLVENCAHWTWKKLRKHLGSERVPLFYQMPFVDQKPKGFMGKAFTLVRKLPKNIQYILFALVIHPFTKEVVVTKKNGTKRKISVKKKPPYAPSGTFCHPVHLFKHKAMQK